ncbi:CU044_2847 family protein [Herbidospora mongoliensis]|uniref:CU044_2847 family protein n=1 Tax=Herbidospora mongoliensis TaxID=688067 RepID=UPI00082A6737|nr:CU044_2847 family protein [Herbidospora mongoliensis]
MQVLLPGGEVIWAHVAVDGPANVTAGAMPRLNVDELRDTVHGVSKSLRAAVDDLLPDQVQVEFGLELTLKSGKLTSILAEAGGKASLKVSLTWSTSKTSTTIEPVGAAPAEDED